MNINEWIEFFERKYGKDCQAVKDIKRMQKMKEAGKTKSEKILEVKK